MNHHYRSRNFATSGTTVGLLAAVVFLLASVVSAAPDRPAPSYPTPPTPIPYVAGSYNNGWYFAEQDGRRVVFHGVHWRGVGWIDDAGVLRVEWVSGENVRGRSVYRVDCGDLVGEWGIDDATPSIRERLLRDAPEWRGKDTDNETP